MSKTTPTPSGSLPQITPVHPEKFDYETDILIVGSGAAGLTAALRARHHGLDTLIIEKSSKIGGASAWSGGGLWLPGSSVSAAAGLQENRAGLLKYMESTIGDVGPVSNLARRNAFLENGPAMVDFLKNLGFGWKCTNYYPDYYPERPGGGVGRCLESSGFDMKKLGEWKEMLLMSPVPNQIWYTQEYPYYLSRAPSSIGDHIFALQMRVRAMTYWLLGQDVATLGRGLVANLLYLTMEEGIKIFRETQFVDLIVAENGRVIGANVKQDGVTRRILARKGVLLCAGGFAQNAELRKQWGPQPSSTEWTVTPPGDDTGDAITAGIKLGAATALLDDAWWIQVIKDPVSNELVFAVQERARPFTIIVDQTGKRFMNEAASYTDCGQEQYARHQIVSAIPAWLIVDSKHRERYLLGSLGPGQMITSEHLLEASSISELAQKTDLPAEALANTIATWNTMCKSGKDTDFQKGDSAYDRFMGDPRVRPNPNMGPIDKPPFYATKLWPGDLGTKGGLLTDEKARVLKENGDIIEGLYATGNTSASVMGTKYIGAGSTLGPGLTFAFIAADNIAAE